MGATTFSILTLSIWHSAYDTQRDTQHMTLSIWHSAYDSQHKTLSIWHSAYDTQHMKLSIMILSVMTSSKLALSIMILSIMAPCCYAECHFCCLSRISPWCGMSLNWVPLGWVSWRHKLCWLGTFIIFVVLFTTTKVLGL